MIINFIYFLAILIFLFVIYTAYKAIMIGFKAKQDNNYLNKKNVEEKNQN